MSAWLIRTIIVLRASRGQGQINFYMIYTSATQAQYRARGDLATGPQTDTQNCILYNTEYGTAFIVTLSLTTSYG